MDYSIINPQSGFMLLKEKKIKKKDSVLKRAEDGESNAYGEVLCIAANSKFEVGQTVVYNEYEGQELMKFDKVTEDNLIIISETNILATIT